MALHSLYCADVPLRNCSLTPCMGALQGGPYKLTLVDTSLTLN